MVIWTNPAKADLKAIHDFIALDSRFYAKKVTTSIVKKTETLKVRIERLMGRRQ
ncbi:MAG: type II toxin-antitoxin system RelE/ParE family toxin [Deltaproteobacteria bacterium]|nr:type II toxin-antitoxin system RelE/ParE family toxin [Deltaproteobacteria bacterium]